MGSELQGEGCPTMVRSQTGEDLGHVTKTRVATVCTLDCDADGPPH